MELEQLSLQRKTEQYMWLRRMLWKEWYSLEKVLKAKWWFFFELRCIWMCLQMWFRDLLIKIHRVFMLLCTCTNFCCWVETYIFFRKPTLWFLLDIEVSIVFLKKQILSTWTLVKCLLIDASVFLLTLQSIGCAENANFVGWDVLKT